MATTRMVGAGGYATIQMAIDAAQAGDTIQVSAGNYAENLTVNKQLNFTGAEAGVTGTGARNNGESSITGTIAVSAPGVSFDGFSITAPSSSGTTIEVSGANTTIKNSIIKDNANSDNTDGIVFEGSLTGQNVTGNLFQGYGTGIYANPGVSGDISGNTFTNTGSGAVLDSSLIKFHGNTLSGSRGADVATDAGGAFATTGAGTDDVGSYIYGNTYNSGRARPVSITPQANNISIKGTDSGDTLRDDASTHGINFQGGGGTDAIKAAFTDLNGDTFSDIVTGESVIVTDRNGVTASVTNGNLVLQSGGMTSTVSLNGASGTVTTAPNNDGTNLGTIVTFTATSTGGGGGGGGGPTSTTPTAGPDNLMVGSGGSTAGGDGNDTITGGGSNLLFGNMGDDIITAGPGPNTVYGGMGNDSITAGDGNNLLFGNEGSDTIRAGNGNNTIVGGQDSTDGADVITSGSGNDVILGNGGDDTISSGGGSDSVVGGYGNDVLLGNQGDDLLLGNQGNDVLYGGQGNDTLYGGMGDDTLIGGQGNDVLYGNEGTNQFQFAAGDTGFVSGTGTGDTVADFKSGTDKIHFGSGPAGTSSNFGSGSVAGGNFAALQAAAQQLLSNGATYAFETNGTDGYLFTSAGNGGGTGIEDALKLAGVKSLQASDIV